MHFLTLVVPALAVTLTRTTLADPKPQSPTSNTISALQRLQRVLHPSSEAVPHLQDEQSTPTHPQILLAVNDGVAIVPADLDTQSLSGIGSLKTALEHVKVKARELDLEQVAIDVETWVKLHPWKAAFYTASFLGFFAPEILSIPALEALGFGALGVRAGSVAAKVQSVIGPVAARSVFAIWQSARMGGYGVANVNGGVRALVALADATVIKCNPMKDCKGLFSSGGGRLLGVDTLMVALAASMGCLAITNGFAG